ncbi:MAG: SDR family oxidoreductase [Spirosomataceae bacterium]
MNPIVIITGGTKGIGKAAVERFMASGHDVVTCARNEAELLTLQSFFQTAYSPNKLYVKVVNMSIKSEVVSFIDFIQALHRPIGALINNTGIFSPGQIHDEPDGILENMIETNLYSAYYLTRGLVANMIERKQGHIFNLCSTASITAYTNGGSYCISKFALYGMTKVLREELKPHGIKVTAILPGATLTASWEGADFPPERFIQAKDVAETLFSAYNLSASAVVEEILIRPQLGDIS